MYNQVSYKINMPNSTIQEINKYNNNEPKRVIGIDI